MTTTHLTQAELLQRMDWMLENSDAYIEVEVIRAAAIEIRAQAEALAREAALLEGLTALKKKWDAEYDSHGIEHAYEESGGVLIGKGQAADELEELLAALAPASAGGEG